MQTRRSAPLVLATLLGAPATGCGGPTARHPEHATHAAGHSGHHHELNATTVALHDAMLPLWEEPDDNERHRRVCTQTSELVLLATSIVDDEPPAGVADQSAWKTAAATLSEKVAALPAACEADGFEAALKTAHDALHSLMELAKPTP